MISKKIHFAVQYIPLSVLAESSSWDFSLLLWVDGQTDRQTDRQTKIERERKRHKQRDRQTDRQTETSYLPSRYLFSVYLDHDFENCRLRKEKKP